MDTKEEKTQLGYVVTFSEGDVSARLLLDVAWSSLSASVKGHYMQVMTDILAWKIDRNTERFEHATLINRKGVER